MTNNDILRRIRYTFDFSDTEMIEIFQMGGVQVTRSDISNWLKKEDDSQFDDLSDEPFAYFLNGFIVKKRGKREGPMPIAEKRLTNNLIFRKLKIALNIIDNDIIEIMKLANFRLGKHELSAFFRNPKQKQYRECKNQILRNFIHGMQLKYRVEKNEEKE